MAGIDRSGAWFSTDEAAKADRTDVWRLMLSDCYREWQVNEAVTEQFRAQIRQRDLGHLSFVECVCTPCAGFRQARQVSHDDEPYVGIQVVYSGAERFHAGDDELRVGPATCSCGPATSRWGSRCWSICTRQR